MKRHTTVTAFHAARGQYGTTYQTADGKTYVRTPWGTRVLDNAVGPCIHEAQRIFARATSMRRFIHASFFFAGFSIGILLTALLF